MTERLDLLYVSQMPPSPPRFGGQVRMHGLMTAIARRHAITALALVEPDDDAAEVERAMRAYCEDVILVRTPGGGNRAKRLLQLRSMGSSKSYERLLFTVPEAQAALDALLARQRFDVVNVEFPFMADYRLRQAPPGAPPPALVLDEHNVEYDVLRQVARSGGAGIDRRVYNALNWRKLRREEERAWREFDGVTVCSENDDRRVRASVPDARTAVIPNAVDVDFFRPRPSDPPSDGRTVLFFGAIHYYPNTEGILHFLEHTWPLLAARHPQCRLKIVGPRPPPSVLAHQSPRVEVTGFVEDLRPHLAEAAVVIAPLRIGGGTRLKILEAMAMGKAVVSTRVGCEGLAVTSERELLIADEPAAFAEAAGRLLDDPALARRVGRAAQALIEDHHSWTAAAAALEVFLRQVVKARLATAA
jgi:glycosyltransferase involved in cell wall biosynthesis